MANRQIAVYDPNEITAIFGGVDVVSPASDNFVTITRPNDMWTSTEGVDGQVVRSKSNSRMIEIKVVLLATSPSNDYLSTVYLLDEKSNSGVLPFFLRDSSGTTTAFALQAWITKMPDITYGKEVGTVEWVFHTGEASVFRGA